VRHFTLKPEHFPSHARDKHREQLETETFLQAKAEASPWAKGQVVDIETEDGWERGCTILGKNRTRVLPSNSLLKGPLEALREKEPTDVFLLSRQARDKRKEHSKQGGGVVRATAGDAESGDTDERSVQFPDGSADDWAVEDFVLAKPKKKKKQLPRYAVLARQGIRREAGAARNGLLLVVIVFVVFVGCCCCSTMVLFAKTGSG